MKINRGALIFAGIILTIIVVVAGLVWFSSLFKQGGGGTPSAAQNFFSSLFPFGTSARPNTTGTSGNTSGGNSGPVPDLRKVSAGPVAGFHFESDGALIYGERETGHLYKTTVDSSNQIRLTNTTLPAIWRMVWLTDDTVVLEYPGDDGSMRDYVAAYSTSTPDQTLVGHFLPISSGIVPDNNPKKILSTLKTDTGLSAQESALDGSGTATVFTSPLKSWRLFSTGAGLYAETSPAATAGYLYRIDAGGGMTKVAGGIPGLMISPDASGRYVAASSIGSAGVALGVLDTKTGSPYTVPVATFAEKCAWGPGETPFLFCGVPASGVNYSIEEWYAGLKASSDDAWVINPADGTATIVKQLAPNANEPIDMIEAAVSPDGAYAAFLNKTDLSLWLLKLKP